MATTTLVSWNLKGSAGPDIAQVVDHLRSQRADLVGLQEVQWHQARTIARALGARSWHWGFKHWPVRTWPEGMAVIGVTRPARVRTRALSMRWRVWSWRRRIVQVATVAGPDGASGDLTLVNLHLSPHRQTELRGAETAAVLSTVAGGGLVVVSGDLNERPGGAVHDQLAAAGLRDAWQVRQGDEPPVPAGKRGPDLGATNWRGWQRGTHKRPSQRLDFVYVSSGVTVLDLRVPGQDGADLARFAGISDHLPVTAVLDLAD
jgi:endonuclease/exonuclease/phosphatase family metal-dependent hydrolase